MLIYLIVFVAFFILINVYFKLADKYNIIDKPNERSSHTEVTIRGGGVIFYCAGLIYFVYSGFQYPIFFAGLTALALISFLDDILTLSSKLRLGIHFFSILALIYELGVFTMPIWLVIIAFVMMVGIINAYNFMDGINGITGIYSFIILCSLAYINREVIEFASNDLIYFSILSIVIFNFYNFRRKARCFAGDVGSVSIAFIILFLLGKLMFTTNNFAYILLLAIYGVDAVLTIFHRLLNKENILEAHRSHLYQYMVHIGKKSHLSVATIYGICQLFINGIFIYMMQVYNINGWIISASILLFLALIYIATKRYYLKLAN